LLQDFRTAGLSLPTAATGFLFCGVSVVFYILQNAFLPFIQMTMELIERAGFLTTLQTLYQNVSNGEGHCVLLSGEAGIGKTSLVKTFAREREDECNFFQGTCDALFTPRPLAPLYDIALQMQADFLLEKKDNEDRTGLFAGFFQELCGLKKVSLIVIEDIQWADEATLDLIKFLARRITRIRCLVILTFRDDDIHSRHPLRNLLGQLPPDSFTRLNLTPLSREAVEKMAVEKGWLGEDVYSISGGNPFYVSEILASYSPGIPDNIKDSVLSVYNRQDEQTRQVWNILSVLPTGFELDWLQEMEPAGIAAVENSLATRILVMKDQLIFFKHELYRRTIESSLSPFLRVALNKKILDLFLEKFEKNLQTERIIHLAKNANEYDLVVKYAPQAAKQAACMGAHIEASRLYLSAIEYYQGNDKDILIQFYECYAYECYLTNQIKDAIIYQKKALTLWKEKGDREKTGNCMRFLSRLWWFDGKRKQAEYYAVQAIEVLGDQLASRAKAMSFSNMSQLKMLSDHTEECIFWGEKAIAIAKELKDEEIHAHALNNMGSALMTVPSSMSKGMQLLQQSLEIALKNSYHEHVARAYTALGSNAVSMKDYANAIKTLDEGINYCEDRDLDSLKLYMLSWKSRLYLETGSWDKAQELANSILKNDNLVPVIKIGALVVVATIQIRKGNLDALQMLLDAKSMAFDTMELQRIIPVLSALLEYEWITGTNVLEPETLDMTIQMMRQIGKITNKNRLYYWLRKSRRNYMPLNEGYDGYDIFSVTMARDESERWERVGCPYEQALALFEGNESDKKKAIAIVQNLGAQAIYEKMKLEMRSSGIKNIPRGMRKSTKSNPALLTERELDVLQMLKRGMQNKEIAGQLFISAKTVDHHISAILFKLDVNSRIKAVPKAKQMGIII
jgi:DNA-binding CsgD family transcriptional regulator